LKRLDCYLKIHSKPPNVVIGVCDEDLIGKILKNDQYCFQITETFYKDQLISVEKACEILKKSPNFNAVGQNIINGLIENKIIHPDGIIKINETPIALRFIL
jgi:hypothetical protein